MAEKDETIEKLKKDLEKVVFAVIPTDVYSCFDKGCPKKA